MIRASRSWATVPAIFESVHLDHDREVPGASDRSEQEVNPLLRKTSKPGVDLDLRFDCPEARRLCSPRPQHEATAPAGEHLRSEGSVAVKLGQSAEESLLQRALNQCTAHGLIDPGLGPGQAVPFLKDRLHQLARPVPIRLPGSEL